MQKMEVIENKSGYICHSVWDRSATFNLFYCFICGFFCMLVAPISCGTPRISRSNSTGPSSDTACDLYGSPPLGSSMSLADRPKSMMRSGSFREPGDDGKQSLLSSKSSNKTSNQTKLCACSTSSPFSKIYWSHAQSGEDSCVFYFRVKVS